MVSTNAARQFALSFEVAEELPHFHLASFRVRKKIFATLDVENRRVFVKLSLTDQSVFCSFDKNIIYPVPNKWGLSGATYIELHKVSMEMFRDAVRVAYCTVAPHNLAEKYNLPSPSISLPLKRGGSGPSSK